MDGRRRRPAPRGAVAAALLLLAPLAAAACGLKADRVEAVVSFAPTVTTAQQAAARSACPTVGNAVQEPADRGDLATSRRYPLRYDITEASAQDKGALYRCLNVVPGVRGIAEESSS